MTQKHQFFSAQLSYWSSSHIHTWLLEKPQLWLVRPLLGMSLFFNMLFRLVIAFVRRSKHLLISWLQSPSTVIFGPKKIKSFSVTFVSTSVCHEVIGPDAMILIFWMLSFFTLLFHFYQEALKFLFAFYDKDGVICISDVTDISHSNLDSSLCFIQSSISHNVPCL